MCGRATLAKQPKALAKRYQAKFKENNSSSPLPNYNIAPTHWHPVVTNASPNELQYFRWGLIPHWAKDPKIASKLINARKETVLEKPSFKVVNQQRCLVPFDGFYEWKKVGKQRVPYRIILPETEIFSLAGIWSIWKSADGETIPTFTVLTQEPNDLMATIHNRMPVILTKDHERTWLDHNLSVADFLQEVSLYSSEKMKAYRVSDRVNQVSNNDARLLEAVADYQQGSLF
ncbi:MAG: SOS response-associated peptidase [Bacteroidota bacterium]